jgi:hypothetical protein
LTNRFGICIRSESEHLQRISHESLLETRLAMESSSANFVLDDALRSGCAEFHGQASSRRGVPAFQLDALS